LASTCRLLMGGNFCFFGLVGWVMAHGWWPGQGAEGRGGGVSGVEWGSERGRGGRMIGALVGFLGGLNWDLGWEMFHFQANVKWRISWCIINNWIILKKLTCWYEHFASSPPNYIGDILILSHILIMFNCFLIPLTISSTKNENLNKCRMSKVDANKKNYNLI
jgi:hypothetical protein